MSVLSDGTIREYLERGVLVIEPFTEGSIQPASVDLHLGEGFLVRKMDSMTADPARGIRPEMGLPPDTRAHGPYNPKVYVLEPQRMVLGTIRERLGLPTHLTGRLDGKSSLARMGLIVHLTGGNIDPGFRGQVTLEMFNASDIPIVLRSGMQIAHMSFLELDRPAERPYGHQDLQSHYQDQVGVTASRYGEEVKHATVESGTAIPDLGPCDICGKPATVPSRYYRYCDACARGVNIRNQATEAYAVFVQRREAEESQEDTGIEDIIVPVFEDEYSR